MARKKREVEQLTVEQAVQRLREAQRWRSQIIKSRVMIENRRRTMVAIGLGYSAPARKEEGEDKEAGRKARQKLMKQADEAIDAMLAEVQSGVLSGKFPERLIVLVKGVEDSLDAFWDQERWSNQELEAVARCLPVAGWVLEQRGLGLTGLGMIVGEAGDLSNYPRPKALWKRFGLVPFQDRAYSTWRKGGGLLGREWQEAGYCPRRRSIIYQLSDSMIKAIPVDQQETNEYRRRFWEAKERYKALHPDYPQVRVNLHGLACLGKRILLKLWCQWNGQAEPRSSDESALELAVA